MTAAKRGATKRLLERPNEMMDYGMSKYDQ